MPEQEFILEFEGYWREVNKKGVPVKSGIFCVYECTHNANENTVTIHQLIYIGESENVNDWIANDNALTEWNKHVRLNNVLCYSFAPIDINNRHRVAAALIFKHKPLENKEYVSSFPFEKTTVTSKGSVALLNTYFTVERT